jgi:hypothetical protein
MSDSYSSSLISNFALVRTGYNWKDGDETQICKIVSRNGTKYIGVSKSGTQYIVDISDIRNLIAVTEQPKYRTGQRVLAVVDYHQLAGETCEVCDVLTVSQFCNDIEYTVRVLKTGKTLTVSQHNIKRAVTLRTPRYKVGQYIGVKHCDGHPYYYDEYIKNGTILSVEADHDRCTYHIKYDDGKVESRDETSLTQPHREKTQVEKDRDYNAYLVSEEQRLLQQLKQVQAQMRR